MNHMRVQPFIRTWDLMKLRVWAGEECVHVRYSARERTATLGVGRESNYVNDCVWGVRETRRLPASVTACQLVTAATHSAEEWINRDCRKTGNGDGRKEGSDSPVNLFSVVRSQTASGGLTGLLKPKQHSRIENVNFRKELYSHIHCASLYK